MTYPDRNERVNGNRGNPLVPSGIVSTPKLRTGDHACHFYQDVHQQWATALPLVRGSVEQGARVLVLVESAEIARVRELFEDSGVKHPGLVIETPEQALGRRAGALPGRVVWERLVREALADGCCGLGVVIEMASMAQDPGVWPRLSEYEARLNEHFTRLPLSMLCQYHRDRFSEELLLNVLRTHPIVFVGGERHDNPYYLPREVLLSGNRHDEFCWYLSKLSETPREQKDARAYLPSDARGWQVYCLGELRVLRDGEPVNWDAAHGATRRVKALFAYLSEQGKNGASKEKLADLLWPLEGDLERSLSRLYHTVHALRMALEPDLATADASHYVISEEDRYLLALPHGTFRDAEAFESLCRRGEHAFKAREDEDALSYYLPAEKLYAGDLFSDIPGTWAERLDDDWCWSRRYWLRDMYLKLMLHLAEIYLRRGTIPESLHYWQRALKLDPCCEEAHRGMMRAFDHAGRPDALVRQYRICERQLRRQENRSPDSQTLALWRALATKRK